MHGIDEIQCESVRRLLSAYSDVIKRVFVGRKEIVLQWKTRKAYLTHGNKLDSMLRALGFLFMTHKKGDDMFAYTEVRHGCLHITER